MARQYGTGRDALLRAAVTVVAQKGLRGATYRSVAAEAGVNNALVARYFGNLDTLLEEALQWAVAQSIEASHLTDFGSSPEEFRSALMEAVGEDPDLQAFQFEMILESRRRPELAPAIRRLYAAYTEAVTKGVRQIGYDIDGPTTTAFFAALDGIMLQYVTGLARADVEDAITALWVLLQETLGRSADARLSAAANTAH